MITIKIMLSAEHSNGRMNELMKYKLVISSAAVTKHNSTFLYL
jgi:hypothetical protein